MEQQGRGLSFEIELPDWQSSFTIPAELLRPNTAYDYSLAVEGDTDNELEVEGTFTTTIGRLHPVGD